MGSKCGRSGRCGALERAALAFQEWGLGWAGGLHQSLHAWVSSGWIFRVTQEGMVDNKWKDQEHPADWMEAYLV